jgi:copper chaperone CopZ
MKKMVKQLETLPGVEIIQSDVPTKSLLLRTVAQGTSREQIEEAVRAIGHRVAAG